MDRYEVENVVDRVKKIYRSSTPSEQKVLRDILQEISMYGQSETYEEIWLSDYKEIPVDIHTFVCDDYYLGKTNDNGKRVYPFWHKTMEEIFKVSNKYEECFFTGATRIGKSSTAITCTAYMLYKLMCLKDPQKFFNKKDISKFSILFFNITKELASGVGYREFQDTILASPWFMSHGARKGSDMNPYYVPEGGKVIINYGSDAAHSLGQQVFVGFCVKGDTLVSTEYGYQRIDSLVDRKCKFRQYGDNKFTFSEGTVRLTKYVDTTIRLETTSGAYVEGTEDHPIMVSGGEYKELSEVLLSDKLVVVIKNKLKHESIKRIGITNYKKPIPVYDVVDCKPHHNFITQGGLILHNCDEMNFARTGVKDVSKAKEHMMDLYNTVTDRVKGTFRMEGEVYGKVFAVSSKKSDSDFMESYMQNQIAAGAGDHMYISDAPQWEVLPPSMFHKEKFYIAVGDRHKRGFVVSDQVAKDKESLDGLKDQGYTLLTPPVDMKSQFIADFDIALRDLAGISVPGSLSYITQDQISKCIGNRKNPFHQEILEIGTDDNYTIEEFFDMDKVDKRYLSMYHYIHLDLSLNADKTGISDVCISGRKNVKDKDGKTISMPTFTHMFSIAIQAPRGANIAYDKITTFIVWLRKQGFNIRGISRDQFQSEYMGQLLESKGFGKVGKISLDRTPDGYMAFRSILSEGRIDLLDIELLQTELINLQRDSFSGKIDHPIGGCFTGDTKIRLVDGRSLSILDLLEEHSYKQNWVYTFNESKQKIEPKRILSVHQTKIVKNLVKVTLDDGSYFTCTYDHKIMLRDGSYEVASKLENNISLMPLYTKISSKGLQGYRLYYEPIEDKWHYEHRKFVDAKLKKGYVVHHCNYNKLDNCPSNLKLMARSKHQTIHNNSTLDYSKTSDSLKVYYKELKGTDREKTRNEACRKGTIDSYVRRGKYRQEEYIHKIKAIENEYGICWNSLTITEKNSYSVRYQRKHNPETVDKVAAKVSINHKLGKYKKAEEAISGRIWYTNGSDNIYIKKEADPPKGFYRGRTFSDEFKAKLKYSSSNMSDEMKAKIRKMQSEDTSNRIWITDGTVDRYINKDAEIPSGFRRGRCKIGKNHKIISVEYIEQPCKVYDLTIEDNPNFALDCGVFVHNSKDTADSLAGAVWNATLSNPQGSAKPTTVSGAIASVNRKSSRPEKSLPSMFQNINSYKR